MAKNCSRCGKQLSFRNSFFWKKKPVCKACLKDLEKGQKRESENKISSHKILYTFLGFWGLFFLVGANYGLSERSNLEATAFYRAIYNNLNVKFDSLSSSAYLVHSYNGNSQFKYNIETNKLWVSSDVRSMIADANLNQPLSIKNFDPLILVFSGGVSTLFTSYLFKSTPSNSQRILQIGATVVGAISGFALGRWITTRIEIGGDSPTLLSALSKDENNQNTFIWKSIERDYFYLLTEHFVYLPKEEIVEKDIEKLARDYEALLSRSEEASYDFKSEDFLLAVKVNRLPFKQWVKVHPDPHGPRKIEW